MKVEFARKPVLRGERVVLRPFAPGDAAVIARIVEDPEVRRFTGGGDVRFDADELERIYADRITADDRLDLAVLDRVTGELVGEVVLNEWDERNRSCNFRTLIGPGGRDRGLGTEATRLLVEHGFKTLNLHRIHLYVYAFNPRARRVYEKAGFTAEGVDRDALWHDGVWVDAVRMSILEHECR
ncbi:GNAT family N-acetyltransferase [Actinoplanes derwentensis]|uniref:Protein N-acetyltransferase, RimJ/RimL family n=1 Tax=Actinoplanes derwentensis TaxID=113562 RepID=A0A1H1TRQ1_9ACTN|nr:GNAT family protein [Actinoplanes derwentensis]GID85112.1 acetyltransferase [Actinoplanes derwentensis]SDS62804.1 Protein N-acetyltransferase, RimJ/RimL family [Actinoplanes derwentensis]